jgi:hypothetical protein
MYNLIFVIMDILNWLYLRTNRLIKTTVNNPKDLVVLGADVTFAKRDDKYQTYAMTVSDLFNSTDVTNTGYYSIDLNTVMSPTVDVTTKKGVIEIVMATDIVNPLPAFGSFIPFTIANADMDFSNPDNVYMQHSVYYNPALNDSLIPYVISTGFAPTGADFAIFNANPALVGAILTFTPGTGTTILAEAGNTYTSVGVSVGTATFTVTRNGAGAISTVTVVDAGTGYLIGDVIVIDGASIGGVSGVDDLPITINNTTYNNQFDGRLYLYYELYNF